MQLEFNEGLSFNFGKKGKIGKKVSKTRFLSSSSSHTPAHYDENQHTCISRLSPFCFCISLRQLRWNFLETFVSFCSFYLEQHFEQKRVHYTSKIAPHKFLYQLICCQFLLLLSFLKFCFMGPRNKTLTKSLSGCTRFCLILWTVTIKNNFQNVSFYVQRQCFVIIKGVCWYALKVWKHFFAGTKSKEPKLTCYEGQVLNH